MSYKISAKNRKLKRILLKIFHIISFQGFHISPSLKVGVIGVSLATIWLWGNWVETLNSSVMGNAFYKIFGIQGYILLCINLFILFLIFGNKSKEWFKHFLSLQSRDSVLIFLCIFFGLILSINSIFVIENTDMFIEGVTLGKWIIISLVWYILGTVGSYISLYEKTNTLIHIEENDPENSTLNKNQFVDKNNMTLPF